MKAIFIIPCRDEEEARAIARSVSPDNIVVPRGLKVRTFSRKRSVIAEIECERGMKSFISTIDDLLQAISIAKKAIITITSERDLRSA